MESASGKAATIEKLHTQFRRYWVASAGLILVAIIVWLLWMLLSPKATLVRLDTPTYLDLESSVSSSGRVVPEDDFLARSSFPGLIQSIDVSPGQTIQAGHMLIRMKDPYASSRVVSAISNLATTEVTNENMHQGGSQEDRMNLRGDLTRAQTEADNAKRSLETLHALQMNGAASGAEVRSAEVRVESAEEQLKLVNQKISSRYSPRDIASWSARIAEAKSTLSSAKESLASANIASPIAGTVYLISVNNNDFVPMGAELLRVADLSKLEVRASFDEADMGKLRNGSRVELTWEGKPGRIWHGTIKHAPLAAVLSGTQGIGECIISVADANGDLPPNTTVTARVIFDQRHHVLTLPREALHIEDRGSYIYRYTEGRLVRTLVKVGLLNVDRWEVLSGVDPADKVALHSADHKDLTDGMTARELP